MLSVLRLTSRVIELTLGLVLRLGRFLFFSVAFNPKLGPLRHVLAAAVGFMVFSMLLVYVAAPLRGVIGHAFMGERLRYDAERWLATAIYDRRGQFVGAFDPRLDSQRDVNWTDTAIELGGHTANPDHKSIPVTAVPERYWQCLSFHEDRYIGGLLNPYGIDLLGVLKIPYSTVKRSIALKRPSLGVGGSTLPMQFARVIYKTPPDAREGPFRKLRRKIGEWWLAPVIYHELTRGGDDTPLKQWAANHLWLAQRTGGAPLHGVEMTSRVVFGKEAKDLSIAEQFVLASAVNKPIILLEGSERLNEVRLDHWRYITEVRAKTCADRLIEDQGERQKILFELVSLANGPPDPKIRPKLQEALELHAPELAKRAVANPTIRANALLPAARFGMREEMKQLHGFGWRESVRGVATTLDVTQNLAFNDAVRAELVRLDQKLADKLNPGFALDPRRAAGQPGLKLPNITVVAANAKGEIVRYFEVGETAPYFGSPFARDGKTGKYMAEREQRRIASTGKMLVAIAAGNENQDTAETVYQDTMAPERGADTCEKLAQPLASPRGRKAIVSFACSLNRPMEWRAAALGQLRIKRLIDGFGFNMPPAAVADEATPPSTAAARGLISGSPRRVHHMASVVLASLTGDGQKPVPPPTLVKSYDHGKGALAAVRDEHAIVPNRLVRPHGTAFVKAMLQAPLCYRHQGAAHGTLKALAHWCASERQGLRLHFAKTGTDTSEDPNQTVDTWIAGGLQFASGEAYSYVVLVGTGSTREPFGRSVHAAQAATPLLEVLLRDLERGQGVRAELVQPAPAISGRSGRPKPTTKLSDLPRPSG